MKPLGLSFCGAPTPLPRATRVEEGDKTIEVPDAGGDAARYEFSSYGYACAGRRFGR
jgi:hypothetical protein